jgi:hypothetical protein
MISGGLGRPKGLHGLFGAEPASHGSVSGSSVSQVSARQGAPPGLGGGLARSGPRERASYSETLGSPSSSA